jgi:hypothetical protein
MKDLIKTFKNTLLSVGCGAALMLPAISDGASMVSLNTQTFTNISPRVSPGVVSNFVSNPVLLPEGKSISVWLTFQGSSTDTVPTNNMVTNATVYFALGWGTATNEFATDNISTARGGGVQFASAYHSASNRTVAWTNFSATTLAGAKYIKPYAITFNSVCAAHVLTNLTLRWSYEQ